MPLLKQFEFDFPFRTGAVSIASIPALVGRAVPLPISEPAIDPAALQHNRGRDVEFERRAHELLRASGADRVAGKVRVEWNRRLRSCAGRANYRQFLISLNPLLLNHGSDEVNRTFLHELAHLLAQFRSGRRRVLPHGPEWRRACIDLGIGDEKRCHNLPLPVRHRERRFVYRCPNCRRNFPRVRPIKRSVACLACCRAHNRGKFHPGFKLKLVKR